MPFILNPRRRLLPSRLVRIKNELQSPIVKFLLWCGVPNIGYAYVHGKPERVKLGKGCSTPGTVFNVISGTIEVGDETFFGHNCMVITGIHRFEGGQRVGLNPNATIKETPSSGNDIRIGRGCFIGSGAIILKNVNIGDNVVVGAGSVVVKDIPSGHFAAGVPAKIIKALD